MNMSDRDQKIIFILLILMVILLPYFFFIKDKKIETEAIKTENVSLQERLDYLKELDANRDTYIKETEQMNKDRDVIIASFPSDIKQENYTMFLLQTEYSSDVKAVDAETNTFELTYPMHLDSVAYGMNMSTPISSVDADTGLNGLTNRSTVTFSCYYDGMKYLLAYLKDYNDPMIYNSISMEFDSATGVVSGAFDLTQYAINGNDREPLARPDFKLNIGGKDVDVSIDGLKLRGNEEVGIFGPVEKSAEDEEAEEEQTEVVEEEADAE